MTADNSKGHNLCVSPQWNYHTLKNCLLLQQTLAALFLNENPLYHPEYIKIYHVGYDSFQYALDPKKQHYCRLYRQLTTTLYLYIYNNLLSKMYQCSKLGTIQLSTLGSYTLGYPIALGEEYVSARYVISYVQSMQDLLCHITKVMRTFLELQMISSVKFMH